MYTSQVLKLRNLIFEFQPGQSFSFMARNVKGQKLNDQTVNNVTGAEAIGAGGSALNLNTIQFDGE